MGEAGSHTFVLAIVVMMAMPIFLHVSRGETEESFTFTLTVDPSNIIVERPWYGKIVSP